MTTKLIKENIPQFIKARENYLIALAMNETNISLDGECKQEVLNENIFKFGRDSICQDVGRRITNTKLDYNMSDKDFIKYCKLSHLKRKSKGLILPYDKYEHSKKEPWNLTADCESRPILRLAEKAFIQASLNILPEPLKTQLQPIKEINNYLKEKEFIEINLSLDVGEPIKTANQILNEVVV